MNANEYIERQFAASIQTKQRAQKILATTIARAAQAMVNSLQAGGKILACGNGGSAADSQHFASELLNRFEQKRRGLPALALTTDSSTLTSIANDFAYEQVFSRQVLALGKPGDILLAISTSGNSPSILHAIDAAKQSGMTIIALTGRDGGTMGQKLAGTSNDIELRVPEENTARIQETHILIIHCLCGVIDQQFAQKE